MSDYISREAAIAFIREQSEEMGKAFDELGGESGIYADAYNDLAEDFHRVPAADVEPVRRWIPCSERMPDLKPCNAGTAYSEAVNVWTTGRKIMVGVWDGTDWIAPYDFWEAWDEQITHWQPIPEPPEEGDAGNAAD